MRAFRPSYFTPTDVLDEVTEQAKEVGALSAKVMAEHTEQGKAAAGGQRGPR